MTSPNEIGIAVYTMLRKEWFSEQQAKYITAQAAHETANFTSNVFEKTKNIFGFKFTGHHTEISSYNGYAAYKTIEDCIHRYADYYKAHKYPGTFATVSAFIHALKENRYFEAPEAEYLTGVRHFMKVYFNELSDHISGAGASW